MKKILVQIGIVGVMFFTVYYPTVIAINPIYIIAFFSCLFILLFSFHNNVLLIQKKYVYICIILMSIILCEAIKAWINNNDIVNAISDFVFFLFGLIPISFFLEIIVKKYNIKHIELVNCIIAVGTLQAICAIMAYLFPKFQYWYIESMISYGYSETRFSQLSAFRWYGVATQLGFTTPIVQIVITFIAIFYGTTRNKKYYYFVLPLIFSAFINARITVLLMVLGIIISIIFFVNERKGINSVKRLLAFLSVLLLFMIIVLQFMKSYAYSNYNWLVNGLLEFIGVKTNAKNIYAIGDYFYKSSTYQLPEGIDIFLGVGANLDEMEIGIKSDVGYVNDIWKFGILGTMIIYYLFYKFVKLCVPMEDRCGFRRYMFLILILFSVFINIKGYIISMNTFTSFLFLFILVVMSKRNVDEEKYEKL